jgi:2-polyprenyl-6-methoxyphenol hydroxylase-like FAD-dependent oxidoreductase
VDARGVAKEAIRRMGLDAEVRAACTNTVGAYTVDADGNVLETFRAEDDDGDGYISEIEILRGDLSQVLYDDTRDGVEYIFGDRIAELTQDAAGVDVTFTGGDRRRFDLVIGAEGLHSALRAMVFGPRERFVHHLGLVLAFYTVPNEFGLDGWMLDYQEAGRSAGLRPVPDPTKAIAMLSFPSPTSTSTTATSGLRSGCCATRWPASAGRPSAFWGTWTTPRTSTSTRSPRS